MEGKKLKLSAIILMGINLLIGAGIYLTPAKAYKLLGLNLFWLLAICAILAIIMALVFAEMAGMFTKTGGVYVYVTEAFGGFWGFNIGFMRFIAAAVALSVQMVALPQMLSQHWPFFQSHLNDAIVSSVFVIILGAINLASVRIYEIFIKFTSWLVLLSLVVTIIVGFFGVSSGNFVTPSTDVVPVLNLSATASGFLLLFYAFVGFENIGVAAQDMENPTRDIPKAIITVLILVTVIYFLLFYVVVGNFGPSLVDPNLVNPNNAAAVVGKVFNSMAGQNVMLFAAFIALIGIGLAMSFAGPRNLVPMGADGYLPESLGKNNARGVPATAIVIMVIVSVIFIIVANLTQDAFQTLVYVATLARLVQYIAVCLATFPLRKKGITGTFRLPFAGILVAIAIIVSVFLMTQVDPIGLWGLLVLIVVSLLVYFLYAKPRRARTHKQA